TDKLQEFGRHNKLTLNTLVQGAWSILLSCYSAEEKIIFGATTSGRPAELKDVESMVGMFINTVPVAIQVSPDSQVLDWLAHLQEQQLNARQYEFVSIGEIQGWSDVPRGTPLFNTLLVFENYPEVSSLWSRNNDMLAIAAMRSVEWSNYPLTITVSVGSSFQLRLDYDRQYYVDETIEQIASHFLSLLENIAGNADCRVHELTLLSEQEQQQIANWNDTTQDYPQ
ncbi:MAG: non-ribosomal peptide synthetase, partial [Gammaproteobacteria bacterium]|nr:non-ribosomal peptide synthetase [Gammaproteobacteria bacterium]